MDKFWSMPHRIQFIANSAMPRAASLTLCWTLKVHLLFLSPHFKIWILSNGLETNLKLKIGIDKITSIELKTKLIYFKHFSLAQPSKKKNNCVEVFWLRVSFNFHCSISPCQNLWKEARNCKRDFVRAFCLLRIKRKKSKNEISQGKREFTVWIEISVKGSYPDCSRSSLDISGQEEAKRARSVK